MEPTEQLSHILPTLNSVVDRIEPEQLDLPTPCEKFSVHDVLDHMIVLGGSFAYWFRGEAAPDIEPSPTDGSVPASQFRKTMDDLLDAVRSPGAMERTITAPMGEMPGSTFARLVAFDGVVHGWDLASATGLDYQLPRPVIAAVDRFARSALTPEMRDGDTFKDATTPNEYATPLESLVAFSGRTL
jgi:uncharacterized protein (TIGR03086 family)